MKLIGAGFRGVGDKTTAGVPVLCGKSILDNRHFLHGGVGHRAFLCPLMTFRVSEGGAIKPVFSGHGLTTVDSGSKLAAAENRIAIRLHGHKAGLQLQQRLGQTDVRSHHRRKIAIVGLADRVRHR